MFLFQEGNDTILARNYPTYKMHVLTEQDKNIFFITLTFNASKIVVVKTKDLIYL